jgi:hypothetical protein
MVGKPFHNPLTGKGVYYRAGQPMGAYTSWAVFALCHHILVRVAAHNCGYRDFGFSQYVILGDDIIIWGDHSVAKEYQRLKMCLGVEISAPKT